jgi:hypothetical protein
MRIDGNGLAGAQRRYVTTTAHETTTAATSTNQIQPEIAVDGATAGGAG